MSRPRARHFISVSPSPLSIGVSFHTITPPSRLLTIYHYLQTICDSYTYFSHFHISLRYFFLIESTVLLPVANVLSCASSLPKYQHNILVFSRIASVTNPIPFCVKIYNMCIDAYQKKRKDIGTPTSGATTKANDKH